MNHQLQCSECQTQTAATHFSIDLEPNPCKATTVTSKKLSRFPGYSCWAIYSESVNYVHFTSTSSASCRKTSKSIASMQDMMMAMHRHAWYSGNLFSPLLTDRLGEWPNNSKPLLLSRAHVSGHTHRLPLLPFPIPR